MRSTQENQNYYEQMKAAISSISDGYIKPILSFDYKGAAFYLLDQLKSGLTKLFSQISSFLNNILSSIRSFHKDLNIFKQKFDCGLAFFNSQFARSNIFSNSPNPASQTLQNSSINDHARHLGQEHFARHNNA